MNDTLSPIDLDIAALVDTHFKTAEQVKHTQPTQPTAENDTVTVDDGADHDVDDIVADIADLPGDVATLKTWALDHVDDLAGVDVAGMARIFNALRLRGVSGNWLQRELKPAIADKRKTQRSAGVSWRDYVDAAQGLGFSFRLNVLSDTVEVNGERISDVTEARLLSHLHDLGFKNTEIARRAFTTRADEQRFHPVQSYLQSLTWDGADHIAALSKYFPDRHAPIQYEDGSQRSVFHAWLLRWMIGAAGKAFNPRTVQNYMIILDGAQGKGKSHFSKWICPLHELHMESAIRTDDKDFQGYVSTKWIWEVGELGATIRKSDREALKAFITQIDVTYRPAFGRYAISKPALSSFIGTVNMDGGLLNDPTGHRRFCPVGLVDIDWAYTTNVDVHQLWAQAYALYKRGEAWRLSPEEKSAHAEIVQVYEVEDVLAGHIQDCFTIAPSDQAMHMATTKIIDRLRTFAGVRTEDRKLSMQLASALQGLGLERGKKNGVRGYFGISVPTD